MLGIFNFDSEGICFCVEIEFLFVKEKVLLIILSIEQFRSQKDANLLEHSEKH